MLQTRLVVQPVVPYIKGTRRMDHAMPLRACPRSIFGIHIGVCAAALYCCIVLVFRVRVARVAFWAPVV